ncbi:MAG: PQQ-binding-like beta-propeller repeat protein, partial [Planctomycetes bacterium]|nr:PQQ-binding-like beta-propeller repeat protein [Planctomycetota bacterium]
MRRANGHVGAALAAAAMGALYAGLVSVAAAASPAGANDAAAEARAILSLSGVKGGLVVHVGCGDGLLTCALRANDSYIVQGLTTSAAELAEARRNVQQTGLYGKVTIENTLPGRLPYVDNLVNLLVCEDGGAVPAKEMMRVLCPGGVACVKRGGRWTKTVKPRPKNIDEWTHYMHDATGNAVANDTVVGPPKHLQWVGSPKWTRHHEHMSSLSALVSSGGRIFYIFDEGSRASIQLPAKWKLIARDAFNGTILWKRDIPLWYTHLWPLKAGPAFLPKRLVAVGDVVYVTLGLDQPLVALDAATGRTIRTYRQSKATEEVICSRGVLFLVVNPRPVKADHYTWKNPVCWQEDSRVDKERPWDRKPRTLLAVDAASGKTLWSRRSIVAPLTLCADDGHVVFHDSEKVVCLDRRSGKVLWHSRPVAMRLPLPTYYAPTLVLYDGVVLFAGGSRKHTMTAFDGATGKELWTAPQWRGGHRSPEDMLVVGGMVWTCRTAGHPADNMWTGYDLKTGKVKRQFKPNIHSYWFHHRCHRSKATVNYLMPSRTGIEYVDWRAETWSRNHWVRGACLYGVMPCNGLTYAPQHPCACYIESKLTGFNALAPARPMPVKPAAEKDRLTRGPAYEEPADAEAVDPRRDWPTYRHDNARSGFVAAPVGADVKPAWQVDLGGRLSSLAVAAGRCYVAQVDAHRLWALDAATGKKLWSFTAGGRIDSAPTIWRGRVLFGSADGYVYCLRASDGQLAWRYLAAPADIRLMSFEQIENVWPVHGSVLVRPAGDGSGRAVVYCVAGRSAFLD